MTHAGRVALLFAASAFLPVAVASAADYDPPVYVEPADEYVPVEVGSGWYLRGDIGYIVTKNFKDVDSELFNPVAGFAPFSPFNLVDLEEKETPIAGSIGFGYHFNDFLRADVNLGLLPSQKFNVEGYLDKECAGEWATQVVDGGGNVIDSWSEVGARNCDAAITAKNTYWTGLANAYVDLGTYAGFTPYVGGGVGLIYSKVALSGSANCNNRSLSETDGVNTINRVFTCKDGAGVTVDADYTKRSYDFLYAATAGVAYQVAKNLSIDVGYQYMNAPDAPFVKVTKSGAMYGEGLDNHQVKVGLRYDLW